MVAVFNFTPNMLWPMLYLPLCLLEDEPVLHKAYNFVQRLMQTA